MSVCVCCWGDRRGVDGGSLGGPRFLTSTQAPAGRYITGSREVSSAVRTRKGRSRWGCKHEEEAKGDRGSHLSSHPHSHGVNPSRCASRPPHAQTHTPPPFPSAPLAGWRCGAAAVAVGQLRLSCPGQRACEGQRCRPEPGQEGSTRVGILRDLLARPSSGSSSERPLPRQPARKGSLWAAALPTASQEAGEWGPAQQCRPVATLGGSSSWSRARALSILRGHTWLSTSLLRENGPRARRGQRRRGAGRAAPSERADRGGAGGRLSPRGGACAPRGRGRGSPGGSPR